MQGSSLLEKPELIADCCQSNMIEKRCDGAPRHFGDYKVTIDENNLPQGVTIEELI